MFSFAMLSRMKTALFGMVLLLPAPLLSAAEPSTLVRELAAGHPRKVVVYGTSLTAGGGWVGQLKTWLAASYPGKATFVNSGLSGKNSAEGLARLQAKVLDQKPDTVFIEFAINDAFLYTDGTPSLSVAEARANLTAMLDRILVAQPHAEIILQTMNPVWDSPAGSNASATRRPKLADYYEMYRSVAKERKLRLIDHTPNWQALEKSDVAAFQKAIPDGTHPTAAATEKVMLPLLKRSLGGE